MEETDVKSRLKAQADKIPAGRFLSLSDGKTELGFDPASLDLASLDLDRDLSEEDTAIAGEILRCLGETGELPFNWAPQNRLFVERNPGPRTLDYLIYRYKFELYPKQGKVADFPVYLLIEPTSACNLRCVMCFQCDKSFTRKPYMGVMDLGFFKDIVDQAVEGGTRAVTLASRGEPTMHKRFDAMLDYVSGKFLDLKVNTNATKLDEGLCHAILDAEVDQMVFSIDSFEARSYAEIRVGGDFDQVLANIKRFAEIRDREYPGSHLETRVSGVYFKPEQEGDGFTDFWSEICDQVGYVQCLERWNTYENDPTPDVTHACHYLWERLYVWWDGVTNPCDADYKSWLSPGNVKEKTIREVWHGEPMRRLRELHLAGRRHEAKPCDRCGI